MKSISNTLFGAVMLASSSMAHFAIMPPMPDRALHPNTTEAPAGCKLLPSDKGWPSDEVWRATFPDGYHKLKGSYGPDWMLQPKTVEEVQKAVNFAREHNIRFNVISTGHDFLGRFVDR
jgi:FAD binding domain